MPKKANKLAIQQLDAALEKYSVLRGAGRPAKGWIRAIRETIGMSGTQLAKRLGTTRQRVSRIEQDAEAGKVTIRTMREVAGALDCEFVCGFVPKTSLEKTVHNRAADVIRQQQGRVNRTMMLEDQQLAVSEQRQILEERIDDLVREMPRSLWDEKYGI